MRRSFAVVALLFLASSAYAALAKHKDWYDSPEAYFLTAAERKQWRAVRTDEEAETFLARFRQRRGGPAFTAMVDHRAGIADRFFSSGDRKGSSTLRGKLVILFGAPAGIATSRLLTRRDPYIPPTPPAVGAPNLSTPSGSHNTRGARHGFWLVTMRFSADKVPAFGGTDYVVTVEVDADDNADRLAKGIKPRDVEGLFAAVIEASITKP